MNGTVSLPRTLFQVIVPVVATMTEMEMEFVGLVNEVQNGEETGPNQLAMTRVQLPLDRLRRKVCDCNKKVGKYTGQVINGFKVLDGYCKKSKSGNSRAIVYKVQCVECGTVSEKYRNCLFENIECRCDCKKVKH